MDIGPNPLQDKIDWVINSHGEETWVNVYKYFNSESIYENVALYCVLVKPEATLAAMKNNNWDLTIGAGGPGFSCGYAEGKEIQEYHPDLDGRFKRIIRCRDFHGRKKDYVEINEEFRLFHNLFHDSGNSRFISFDDCGDEVDVITDNGSEIKIRKNYLLEFMAATQMDLLLYFEFTSHWENEIDYQICSTNEVIVYKAFSGPSYIDGFNSFTRVIGKKLIKCGNIETSGIWPFENQKIYQDFIIGGDLEAPVLFNCNPEKLANYFGANLGAPNYLTPVFFKKEVMLKYYNSSDYEITDGHLYRKGAWDLRFDNNSQDHIAAFLGDLGKGLPSREQLYWKSYNIPPEGRKISRTNFERSFKGNFFDPENPEHEFKRYYNKLDECWGKYLGWPIFLPLAEKDNHFFSSIRSMLANEQSEFDSMILAIAKVTIDSINIKRLREYIIDVPDDSKSIDVFGLLLKKIKVEDADDHVLFLRAIQSIRSTGVAHRKGTEYEKVMLRFKISGDSYRHEFDTILGRFVLMFKDIIEIVSTNKDDDGGDYS